MEERRQTKRRRLDASEITETVPNGAENSTTYPVTKPDRNCVVPSSLLEEFNGDTSVTKVPETKDAGCTSIVCYGMVGWSLLSLFCRRLELTIWVLQLENLPVTSIPTATVIDDLTLVRAYLDENGVVQRNSDRACVGKLDDRAVQCLLKLGDDGDIEIQLMLKAIAGQVCRSRSPRRVALVAAIIYGPEDLANDVGDFLDGCNYCLQDPFGCERNVPYKNPHCLSTLFETAKMTFELHDPDVDHQKFTMVDSLRALETVDDLPEWPQPAGLKTNLCRHVKHS